MLQRTLVPSFFLSSLFLFCLFTYFHLHVISCDLSSKDIRGYVCVWGVRGCVRVCTGVHRCARVCVDMPVCGWVGTSVHKCALMCVWKCLGVCECVWDEFSEYLLENRVPTSVDFNTYPIRILYYCFQKWTAAGC